jgi:hypothetical protein
MSIIMTHNAVFVGKADTDFQNERYSFSCNVRIDEVDGKSTAVMMRSSNQGNLRSKNIKDIFSSLGKLERFDMVVITSIWSKTTVCDVYAVEFVDYKKKVSMNEFNDLGLGPNIDERLEVRLSGGWTIDVGNRDKLAGIVVGYGEPFPSEKDLAAIRREMKLGGLLG